MMSFLQTGKALYVLAAICLAGIFTRLAAGSFYKRLIKESTNLALTKNKCLRALRQNAEAVSYTHLDVYKRQVLILTMRIRPEGLMGYKELSLKPFKRLYRKLRGSGKEGREV